MLRTSARDYCCVRKRNETSHILNGRVLITYSSDAVSKQPRESMAMWEKIIRETPWNLILPECILIGDTSFLRNGFAQWLEYNGKSSWNDTAICGYVLASKACRFFPEFPAWHGRCTTLFPPVFVMFSRCFYTTYTTLLIVQGATTNSDQQTPAELQIFSVWPWSSKWNCDLSIALVNAPLAHYGWLCASIFCLQQYNDQLQGTKWVST